MHCIFLPTKPGQSPRTGRVVIAPKDWGKLEPLRLKAIAGDRGVGDIVKREFGWKGEPKFEAWFRETIGKTCKGGWTVEMVNQRWPLESSLRRL
jgi:hypothetical protein